MENHKNTKSYNSYYLIPALICGMLTGWIVTGSVGYTILGAILGLLTAGFWMNVVVNKSEEA
jgi:fructose-specific phosphotransferase system IIC component